MFSCEWRCVELGITLSRVIKIGEEGRRVGGGGGVSLFLVHLLPLVELSGVNVEV